MVSRGHGLIGVLHTEDNSQGNPRLPRAAQLRTAGMAYAFPGSHRGT
ncbi:hypothetical protein PSDT_1435 [Parascardovia denticolens DSM 10105 = JCM 12538]|nr:hypothetical protein PSDT_1435 [Parascardovia denticolens DSM 10105 = JCM 12538]